MGDRLLEGGTAQSLFAGLAPPFDGEVVEAGLGEMMGDDLPRGRGALGLVAQDFGGAAVQRLAAALEQVVVSRILDQRMLEAILRLVARALDDEEVRAGEPVERRLESGVGVAPSTTLRVVPLPGSAALRCAGEDSAPAPVSSPVKRGRACPERSEGGTAPKGWKGRSRGRRPKRRRRAVRS
jgi:hypothetical protein